MTTTTAYINRSSNVRDDIDTMTVVPVATVLGSQLKAGMVLVDPVLEVPVAEIDHKVSNRRGTVEYLIHYYDSRSFGPLRFTATADIKVMAR